MSSLSYKLEISKQWDVLGPFPVHAREQQHLSPSFPLNLSEPIDFAKKWPSSYADGGSVGWTTTPMTDQGELSVSFPEIRWKYLRSFEGWAALQHHTVLRTTFKIVPFNPTSTVPRDTALNSQSKPNPFPPNLNILVHLHQGSYFTVLPKELGQSSENVTPKWYAGNIYDLRRSLPRLVELPPSETGEYHLFVSGDYEIRLFGDPVVQEGSDVPVQHIKLEIDLGGSSGETFYVHEPSQDVICGFVDGYAFGDTIGIGLRSHEGGWTVVEEAYTASSASVSLGVKLQQPVRIAPGQTRVVPLRLSQHSPFKGTQLDITLRVSEGEEHTGERASKEVSITLPLRHLPAWPHTEQRLAVRASYLFGNTNPTIFSVLPPLLAGRGSDKVPILALHGAGVDVVESERDLWANAMPQNDETWVIMPSGGTSWGLDWHGPSALEAWASVSALSDILQANKAWRGQAFPRDTQVVLMGHSNGGQGVWHLATHFPNRVVAAVPAAGYIKSQAYIPLTHSRSAHYIDPMLRAILETSLTPDDNDLHLANIAHIPILAVHGGADENVPSWHSRELVSVLRTLNSQNNSTFKEDPGQGHWYASVLSSATVQEFVDGHIGSPEGVSIPKVFTLTVSNPAESGPLHGVRIQSLVIPGRLGVLHISFPGDGIVEVSATNVLRFFIEEVGFLGGVKDLVIDKRLFALDHTSSGLPLSFVLKDGHWVGTDTADGEPELVPPPTRLQSILSTQSPAKFLYDTEPAFSLARRLAHDLLTYHRLDADLLVSSSLGSSLDESTVIIGTLESPQIREVLERRHTSFGLRSGELYLANRVVDMSEGQSCIFLHPPSKGGYQLVIIYSDEASLERAGRLFPIRTGVAAPNWLYLSPRMDREGAAGIQGAGVWSSNWTFQPESSWWSGS